MNKPIVEGIIATANHKLRVEGIKSYKKYLSQPYYFEKELEEARKETEDRILKTFEEYQKKFPHVWIKSFQNELKKIITNKESVSNYFKEDLNSIKPVQTNTQREGITSSPKNPLNETGISLGSNSIKEVKNK